MIYQQLICGASAATTPVVLNSNAMAWKLMFIVVVLGLGVRYSGSGGDRGGSGDGVHSVGILKPYVGLL